MVRENNQRQRDKHPSGESEKVSAFPKETELVTTVR